MGPITLVDEVGMDVAYHVQETLAADLGVRMAGNGLEAMKELVDAGCLGKKTGKGMYVYKKGSKDKPENPDAMAILKKYSVDKIDGLSETEIQERVSW